MSHGRGPATCHPDRPGFARGLCRQCYYDWWKRTPGGHRSTVDLAGAYYRANRDTILDRSKTNYWANLEERRTQHRIHYRANRATLLPKFRRQYRDLRRRVMEKLGGGVCVRCGCDDERLLEINHKRGGGRKEGWSRRMVSNLRAILAGTRKSDDLEVVCKVCNVRHYIELRFPELRGKIEVRWLGREVDG
jgi:hypothetical protein